MNAIELSGWKQGARVTLPVNEDEYLEELNKRRATEQHNHHDQRRHNIRDDFHSVASLRMSQCSGGSVTKACLRSQ